MAASERSEFSVDVEGKWSTQGAGKDKRFPNSDDFIITTRVQKGLKRLKFLETEISRKKDKVAKVARSRILEPYTKARDELVEQMQKDIPELQSIFDDEYSNTFERKDIRRTTTSGMRKENRETLSLRSAESEINQLKSQLEKERKAKDEALSRLRSVESEISQLKSQLENERKSNEEALSSLRNAKSEINQLTSQLENERKSNEEALSLRSAESEINQLTSQLEKGSVSKEEALSSLRSTESEINHLKRQLENERKSKEETLSRLNRRLDESENEKVALKLTHQEEIRVHKEEIRKLQERLTIDKSYEERAKALKRKCDELETDLARSEKKLKEVEHENKTGKCRLEDENRRIVENLKRLEDENRRIVENIKRFEAKNNLLNNQLKNERKAKEDALLRLEAKNNKLINQLENERKAKENALVSLRSAESDINQWKSQLENERKSNEEVLLRLNRRLDESENEKVALRLSHKEEIGIHKEEIRKLQERLTIDKSYEERAKALKRKCDELETDLARLEAKTNQLNNQLENETKAKEDALLRLTKSYEEREKEFKRKCDELTNELARLRVKNNQLNNQLENERKAKEDALLRLTKSYEEREKEFKRKCDELTNELARLRVKNNQLNNQLENERKAKEDALLRLTKSYEGREKELKRKCDELTTELARLSSMASNRLRDNNPNIADLSDPNRPTKLCEQFSDLFDNEWTDAFDELDKLLSDIEEKQIISYLRDFVLEIHSVCSDLSFSKMKTIEEAFVKPSVPSENTKIPTKILETIKEGIKSIAPKLLEDARELVLRRLEQRYLQDAVAGCLQHHNIKRYIDKCTEVCWYMSVQDPQLVMDGSKSANEKFDSNKHREYTKKGPYEEFVVWPVLYLYKGGQMLSKGVAQGTKKETICQQ